MKYVFVFLFFVTQALAADTKQTFVSSCVPMMAFLSGTRTLMRTTPENLGEYAFNECKKLRDGHENADYWKMIEPEAQGCLEAVWRHVGPKHEKDYRDKLSDDCKRIAKQQG